MSDETVSILVFSDDKDKRAAVVNGVGLRASKDTPRIEWVEAATGFGVRDAFDQEDFAVLILDAEAKKEGGMSIAQDLLETREDVPPIIFLTARAQDEWLRHGLGSDRPDHPAGDRRRRAARGSLMTQCEWAPIIAALTAGQAVDYDQSYWLMDEVMSGELGEARLASFLTAMAIKGATVAEIHGLADGMAHHATSVDLPSRALDIVGTGGDGYKTVNVSTMSAIVLAAMGIPLVKHGNRASTSKSGSADVIEALGVNLNVDTDRLRAIFDEVGIAFLFANKMHPSMRFAAPVRRALGFPTAFNVLGPLTNPAKVQACAVGSAKEDNARLMAGVYASRGCSALVFRGATTGLDELTTADTNQVWIVSGGRVTPTDFDARDELGMAASAIDDLAGGEASYNAAVARDVLSGGGSCAVRDAVALNVGAGLDQPVTAQDFAPRMRVAVERAARALADGTGARLVERWAQVSNG
mgnify:CR=1 FL=1